MEENLHWIRADAPTTSRRRQFRAEHDTPLGIFEHGNELRPALIESPRTCDLLVFPGLGRVLLDCSDGFLSDQAVPFRGSADAHADVVLRAAQRAKALQLRPAAWSTAHGRTG